MVQDNFWNMCISLENRKYIMVPSFLQSIELVNVSWADFTHKVLLYDIKKEKNLNETLFSQFYVEPHCFGNRAARFAIH